MIYLKNNTLLQDVYIPRQDMLPYTTGSSGTYAEGYSDGYEDGTQDQKDKLASTAFTENGLYTREDGWNEVEVSVEAPLPVLEDKTVVISADTTKVTPSSGYYGMSAVTIDATEYGQQNYDSGFDDGYIDGYASGSTEGYESGYTSGSTDGYNSGYTSGETHQKSLLVSTAITQNGSYQRENGYSAITVNVPTGQTYNIEQNKPFTATSNGDYTITPSSGQTTMRTGYEDGVDFYFTASTYPSVGYFEIGTIEFYNRDDESIGSVDIYYNNGQINYDNSDWDYRIYTGTSGNTMLYVGFNEDDYSDYVWREGEDFSFNYDVMSAVSLNVNVPQTGHTDQELQDAYDSGYTSGSTDGFNSGYTSGETHQKSLLVSTAITQNGTYTRENGYSAITVNVPQTGSTNSIISVTGNTWYELDHQFTTGEKIEITNATFDYSFASPARHQQLIAGGGGEWIRIGGNRDNLYTSYYGDNKITCGPIVLDDDHILLTNGAFYINDMETPVSTFGPYQTGIAKGSNMVVFANSAEGSDSVCGQTASVGVITIYDENDNVVDKYIPELHNGVACFHNIINGNYITPSGTGTPTITNTDYNEGYIDGRQDVINTFTSTTATTNGVYGSSAHPLSSITVNVPQTGGSGTTKIFFADYIHTDTLKADSRDRIDTGIYPTTATTFRVKGLGKGLSAGYELAGFDLEDAGEDYDYRLFCYSTSGENLGFDWYSQRITNENWGGLTDGKSIDFTCSNYQVYDNINETVLISGNPQSNMSQNIPIYVNVGSWWLKGLEIWEGNTKVFDGVAAYDENGNVGLYDSVSNSLVTNTGLTIVYENVDEYQYGYNDGQSSIINTFSSMTATTNGVYGTSAHPLSAITVNVPTGSTSYRWVKLTTDIGSDVPIRKIRINAQACEDAGVTDFGNLYFSRGVSGITQAVISDYNNDPTSGYPWNNRFGIVINNQDYTDFSDSWFCYNGGVNRPTDGGDGYFYYEYPSDMYFGFSSSQSNFTELDANGYYEVWIEVSDYDLGYTSGVTDGENNIISTFSSMTATTNGVYGSSAHPLSSVTVNVNNLYDKILCVYVDGVMKPVGYYTQSPTQWDIINKNYTTSSTLEIMYVHYYNHKLHIYLLPNGKYGYWNENDYDPQPQSITTVNGSATTQDELSTYTLTESGSGLVVTSSNGSNYEVLLSEEIMSELSAITITSNTAITVNNGGYSAITVNVPQTGSSADLIPYIERTLTRIDVPSGCTKVGPYAFDRCYSATSITIPDSVTFLDIHAFAVCDEVTAITFGNGLVTIGDSAFYKVGYMSQVVNNNNLVLPDSVSSINSNAFLDMPITAITFGSGTTYLGDEILAHTPVEVIYSYATSAPQLRPLVTSGGTYYRTFRYMNVNNGTVHYPSGSDYSRWQNNQYLSGWTFVGDL